MDASNSRKRPHSKLQTTPTRPPRKKAANFETPPRISRSLEGNFECEDVDMESAPKTLRESSTQASSCCISDVRGQEQAELASGQTCASATSGYDRHFFSLLRTGFPLQEEELLLYSLTVAAFPENGFNLKDKWLDKYQPIVNAIESVYHVHFNCSDIRNYFHRVRNNLVKGLGKVKGKVRWMYYKDNVIEVLNGFKLDLEDLLADSDSVARDKVEDLRSCLRKQCLKLAETDPTGSVSSDSIDNPVSEILDLENDEQITKIQKKFPQWKVDYNEIDESGHLFLFSGNKGYAELEVVINRDQSWCIILDGRIHHNAKLLSDWAEIPDVLTLVSELQLLMSTIENCRICKGCPYENFKDVVPSNEREPVFQSKSEHGAAYVERRPSHFHEKVIRSSSCMVFLPGNDDLVYQKTLCELCSKTEHYLRTKKSRCKQKGQETQNDTSTEKLKPGQNFAHMSKEELLNITRHQSNELKNLQRKVKRLEECRKKMSEVGEKTDSDFRFLFERLEKGMTQKQEKLKNPVCKWAGCSSESFQDVQCLFSHVKEHVPDPESNTAPVDRVYVCMYYELN